ncbi:MAG: polyphenol oxidase family protein [Vicinamibacteraceae bacterium]
MSIDKPPAPGRKGAAGHTHQHNPPTPDPAPEVGFYWTDAPWGRVVRCAALDPFADHFFSARGLEPLAIDVPPHLTANQPPSTRLVAEYLNASPGNVWRVRQVHGAAICTAPATPRVNDEDEWPMADALVTDRPDLVLTVRTADCVPLLLVDPVRDVAAAVHAGWRGLASRVIAATLAHLQSCYRVRATDVVAALGPSIGPARYAVREDVPRAFLHAGHDAASCSRWFHPVTGGDGEVEGFDAEAPNDTTSGAMAAGSAARRQQFPGGEYLFDMWQASRDALMTAGVPPANIHVARLCAATHVNRFHSYRIEGAGAGRMINAIRPNRLLRNAG